MWSGDPPIGREWSGAPPGRQGVVRRPSLIAGSGREAHLDGREWLETHHGESAVAGRPFWRAGIGREALPEGQDWSEGPQYDFRSSVWAF